MAGERWRHGSQQAAVQAHGGEEHVKHGDDRGGVRGRCAMRSCGGSVVAVEAWLLWTWLLWAPGRGQVRVNECQQR